MFTFVFVVAIAAFIPYVAAPAVEHAVTASAKQSHAGDKLPVETSASQATAPGLRSE